MRRRPRHAPDPARAPADGARAEAGAVEQVARRAARLREREPGVCAGRRAVDRDGAHLLFLPLSFGRLGNGAKAWVEVVIAVVAVARGADDVMLCGSGWTFRG